MLEGSTVKSKSKKDKRNKIKQKNSTLNLVVRRKPTISAKENKDSNN